MEETKKVQSQDSSLKNCLKKSFSKSYNHQGLYWAITLLNRLAATYSAAESHEEAIDAWELSLQYAPQQIGPYLELALNYLHVEEKEKAKNTIQKLLELWPSNVLALDGAAWIYTAMGELDLSSEVCDKLLEMEDSLPEPFEEDSEYIM